ncbi:MAG: hypothetical protein P8K08_04470 [Fuerstiella sp.]|nr:hypothetical protein [Fuerstiella sp.]
MSTLMQLLMGCLMVFVTVGEGFAQRITIQQPVVSQFRVSTMVSVPDRGSTFLGSVSRAGSSRLTTGPFRSGSSVGRYTDYNGARVSVYIHDFEELERQLLADSPVTGRSLQRLSGRETHTFETALSQLRSARPRTDSRPATVLSGNLSRAAQRSTATPTTAHANSTLADTSYGRARIARQRNFDRVWSRLQKPRQFASPANR